MQIAICINYNIKGHTKRGQHARLNKQHTSYAKTYTIQ